LLELDSPAAWQGKIKVVLSAQTARREEKHHKSSPAVKLLKSLAEVKVGDLIFPNIHSRWMLSP